MDVDISDILAEASRPANTIYHPLDADSAYTDHQLLVRAWTSERCTPDLLPYPAELMARVTERVQSQISRIEDLMGGAAEAAAHAPVGGGKQNLNLVLSILQTDLSRTQFIVRSLLRQRLAKLTKFAAHYLARLSADDKTAAGLLSEAEARFLGRHQGLLSGFYEGSFLASFPKGLRRLDDRSGGEDMVEGPDEDGAVVVRCVGERWGNEVEVAGDGGASVELRLNRGDIMIARWRDVRVGVLGGEVELL